MASDRRGTNLCASTVGRSARVAGPLPQQGQDGVGPPGTNLCASTVGRSARVAGPLSLSRAGWGRTARGLTCVPLLLAGVPGLLVLSLSRGRMGSDRRGLTCVPLLLAGVPGLLVRSLSRGRMGSDLGD